MKKNRLPQLRKFVKLKKEPPYAKLDPLSPKLVKDLIDLANTLEISNDLTVNRRENLERLEYNSTHSPLGKTYNQKHIKQAIDLGYIEKIFSDISDMRFAILDPYAVVPRHLDDPEKLNIIITLTGNHTVKFDDQYINLYAGDVIIINPAFHHEVINGKDERIALLLKVTANESNINLLRTRAE